MQWDYVTAIVIGTVVMAFPAALVWYLAIGGTVAAIKDARARKAMAAKTHA